MAKETKAIFTRADNDPRDRIARFVLIIATLAVVVVGAAYYIHCKHVEQAAASVPATVGETNATNTLGLMPVTIRGQFKE